MVWRLQYVVEVHQFKPDLLKIDYCEERTFNGLYYSSLKEEEEKIRPAYVEQNLQNGFEIVRQANPT